MALQAQYATQPIIEVSQISTANTNKDGTTGTYVTVSTGPAVAAAAGVGQRVNKVTIIATSTTTAGVIRFFYTPPGGTVRMICEKAVAAVTPSATAVGFRMEVPELVGFVLPGQTSSTSAIITASTEKAETFNILVESGRL